MCLIRIGHTVLNLDRVTCIRDLSDRPAVATALSAQRSAFEGLDPVLGSRRPTLVLGEAERWTKPTL